MNIICSEQLLKEYEEARSSIFEVNKVVFEGVGDRDVYNITAPFVLQDELLIAGRVEVRDSEESEVYFFVKNGCKWVPRENTVILKLQDPFFTFINGEFIVGGVQTFPHPTIKNALGWRTIFYKGTSLNALKEFFKGPDGMKDLRIVQLMDKRIGIFTRPQGEKGGRGKIGFTIVESLEKMTIQIIEDAPLLEDQFVEEEWGGCNEIHVLKDGSLGVLGHMGCFDPQGDRHYYSVVFQMNPNTKERTKLRVLAIRRGFLASTAKRKDLADVVFSGGLVRHSNGTAVLYAGIGDADAQCMVLKDPFAGL